MLLITQASTIKMIGLTLRAAAATAPVMSRANLLGLADKFDEIAEDRDPYATYKITQGMIEAVHEIEHPINYAEDIYPRVPVVWTVRRFRDYAHFDSGEKPEFEARADNLYQIYKHYFDEQAPSGIFEFGAYATIGERALYLWRGKFWTIQVDQEA